MDCPLCDGFGVIGDPLRAGRLKKCPECDTPVGPLLTMTLAGWCFGPDGPTEDDDMAAMQEDSIRRAREEEEDYMRRHLAGMVQDDLPPQRGGSD